MKFTIQTIEPDKHKRICQVVGIFEGEELPDYAKKIDKSTHGSLVKMLKTSVFTGKRYVVLPLISAGKGGIEQVFLVGCGKRKDFSADILQKIVLETVRTLDVWQVKEAIFYFAALPVKTEDVPAKIRTIVEAINDTLYRFDLFKSKKDPKHVLNHAILHNPDPAQQKACEQALKIGKAISAGVSFTKNLGNLPSNICTPTFLSDQAKELARDYPSLSVNILNEKAMQKLGMGALLAVSQGSAQEAQLICVEYKGGDKKQAPVCLVGKGITFDTGGNSLKTPDSMVGMKYDMCGAATVLGVLKTVAMLKLPLNVVGIIAAAENMPGGTAYKPEDIITSLSGQTIEVISTDAEGRLVLADALTYSERYRPDVVIDIATLTGAVVIALGFHATGLMSNNEELAQNLLKAGIESNDKAWQLPLWDVYQEQIKSPFADMSNVGGRPAGSITAGCFLSRFAKNVKWAHLDVAGTAALMMGSNERRATGRPVPLLVQYLLDRTHA